NRPGQSSRVSRNETKTWFAVLQGEEEFTYEA
ncbi:unnamed protein product, partial [marine sediment metagenome]